MQEKLKNNNIIVGAIIVVLLIGGFIFFQNSKPSEVPTTPEEVTPTVTEAISPGEEAPSITEVIWHWASFTDPKGGYDVDNPEMYTIFLSDNGTMTIKADCNEANTSYELSDSTISMGPIATTLAECSPESLSSDFLINLQMARVYFVQDGNLFFDLEADGGTMKFIEQ